jgi:hypothetical protein
MREFPAMPNTSLLENWYCNGDVVWLLNGGCLLAEVMCSYLPSNISRSYRPSSRTFDSRKESAQHPRLSMEATAAILGLMVPKDFSGEGS